MVSARQVIGHYIIRILFIAKRSRRSEGSVPLNQLRENSRLTPYCTVVIICNITKFSAEIVPHFVDRVHLCFILFTE